MGRLLIALGLILLAVGVWISLGWPFPLGRLPGDVHIRTRNAVFYFPIVTCILLSVILTLVFTLFRR